MRDTSSAVTVVKSDNLVHGLYLLSLVAAHQRLIGEYCLSLKELGEVVSGFLGKRCRFGRLQQHSELRPESLGIMSIDCDSLAAVFSVV